jgi:lactoylglutathione lyase
MGSHSSARARRALVTLVTLVTLLTGCSSETYTPSPPPAALAPANRDSMGLRHELMVSDVQRSLAFYTGVLGFAVERTEDGYAALRAGTVRLGVQRQADLGATHYFRPELESARKGLGVEIVLEVDDVQNYAAAVSSAGYPMLGGLKRQAWGATDFRLVDPDGYYVRITSRN